MQLSYTFSWKYGGNTMSRTDNPKLKAPDVPIIWISSGARAHVEKLSSRERHAAVSLRHAVRCMNMDEMI